MGTWKETSNTQATLLEAHSWLHISMAERANAAAQGQQSEYRPRKAVGARSSSAVVSPATVHSSLLQNTGRGGGGQPPSPGSCLKSAASSQGGAPQLPLLHLASLLLPGNQSLACLAGASWQSHRENTALFGGTPPVLCYLKGYPLKHTLHSLTRHFKPAASCKPDSTPLHQFWSNTGEQIGTKETVDRAGT